MASPATCSLSTIRTKPPSAPKLPFNLRGPVRPLINLSSGSVPPGTPSVAIPTPAIHASDHSLPASPSFAPSVESAVSAVLNLTALSKVVTPATFMVPQTLRFFSIPTPPATCSAPLVQFVD